MNEEFLKSCVVKMKNGNLEVFNAFYEECKKSIFYNIFALTKNHEISEDLLHDTFVKFLNEVSKVDVNKSISGYLMVMSRNLTLDYFKKHNRIEEIEDDSLIPSDNDSSNSIDQEILLNRIKKILNDKEFEVFVLHVLDDLSFKEIAKLRHRPLGTTLYQYNSAIKKLQEELEYEAC
ncbi:MAG: sigma-70 family RNA polymerase sigma factor [Firmicutes bacterium]|uniref:Sigma-70 family RNA polymerase sigma factor n=1 Tax=Candidatus Onthovivens merdipullorum TaxID=2840889 RepID=A0A9D9DIW1_9BACL|nr:sigma-70 family RNA polymerase sigma factor [Candidatus Onthovivens merdipullorum]